jgi:hypothetical protein
MHKLETILDKANLGHPLNAEESAVLARAYKSEHNKFLSLLNINKLIRTRYRTVLGRDTLEDLNVILNS